MLMRVLNFRGVAMISKLSQSCSLERRSLCSIRVPAACKSTTAFDDIERVKKLNEEEMSVMRAPEFIKALTPPIVPHSEILAMSSLESYLEARGWRIAPDSKADATIRVISQLLSFPLSIGWALRQIESCIENESEIRIACIGARAEATLPPKIWMELSACCSVRSKLTSIHFVGPETSQPKVGQEDTASSRQKSDESNRIQLLWSRNKYHELTAEDQKCNVAVLFNPGLGNTTLHNGWLPTFVRLMKLKIPVVLTAYSKQDLSTDLEWISNRQLHVYDECIPDVEWIVRPTENPFRSRRKLLSGDSILAANEVIYIVRGCDRQ